MAKPTWIDAQLYGGIVLAAIGAGLIWLPLAFLLAGLLLVLLVVPLRRWIL